MYIEQLLKEKNLTKYRLSKLSGVPQTTINDLCSGKTRVEKCSSGTLYKISQALNVSMEELIETDTRNSFELFKSNLCHRVKDIGEIDFIIQTLEKNDIRILYEKKWYPEAFYHLAMLDYLSRINNLPTCTNYNDIRCHKLEKPLYSSGIIAFSAVTQSDQAKEEALKNAIPEFLRFNIVESEIRNVV